MRKLSSFCFLLVAPLQSFARSVYSDNYGWDNHQRIFEQELLAINGELTDIIDASPLLSFHRELVQIPSVSLDEEAIGNFLEEYLVSHNFTVQKQTVPGLKPRYNIIARPDPYVYGVSLPPSQIPGPKTLLSSHIDTVPPFLPYELSKESIQVQREAVTISGRGTVDDKACVAAQTHALLSLLATHQIPPTSVALVLVVGEEGFGDGMRTFSESDIHQALANSYKTVIFGEPTEGKLASGHKGAMGVHIATSGKAAHSGYPWLGRSAVSTLIPILAKLDELGSVPESEGGLPKSEKYGNTTVNIGRIEGGVAGNVVAENASASITVRIAGGSAQDVQEIVTFAIFDTDVDLGGTVVSFSEGYGPVDIDHDVKDFETITVNYGTDIPYLEVKEGVKRYLYGPGSILVAHGPNEGLTIGDMEKAVDDYQKLILASLDV